VLVVDQAEELFTLCTDGAQREAFAHAPASAAADASVRVRVVPKHGRTRRLLRQLAVDTIGFLAIFLLTEKAIQYVGVSLLAGDTINVVLGILCVPLTWLLLRRTRTERAT
jgi:hypothetical protein